MTIENEKESRMTQNHRKHYGMMDDGRKLVGNEKGSRMTVMIGIGME